MSELKREKKIRVLEVIAFTKNGNGGNKAGVVFETIEDDEEKLEIASAMNYSETVFVKEMDFISENCDLELRYFTPEGEVDLCGHATIATFSCLFELGLLIKAHYTIKTKAGILAVDVKDGLVMMEQKLPVFSEYIDPEEIAGCFVNFEGSKSLCPQVVSTGLRDVIVPVADERVLNNLSPDYEAIKQLSVKYGTIGIHAFALSDRVDAVCRNFAPLYGISEESATGTSNCALSAYLYANGTQKSHYVYEQGVSMGLESLIYCDIDMSGAEFRSVKVGGYGKIVKERYCTLYLDSKEGI